MEKGISFYRGAMHFARIVARRTKVQRVLLCIISLLSFFFLFFPLFDKIFGAPKIIKKMQIKYPWIPCEKGIILEPLLKQIKLL
jgi:hypothetical protein